MCQLQDRKGVKTEKPSPRERRLKLPKMDPKKKQYSILLRCFIHLGVLGLAMTGSAGLSNTLNADTYTQIRPLNFSIDFPLDYKEKTSPMQNGAPAIVEVEIHPWKIGDISVQAMTFEADLYMTINWRDFRLKFNGTKHVPKRQTISFDAKEAEKVWKPVINFRNVMGSKGMSFDPSFFPLRLKEEDLMFYALRKVAKFHCKFDLALYPFDVQVCFVEIQAFSYKSAVILRDVTEKHELRSGAEPPQFRVASLSSGNCTREDGASKYYSCVEYKFILQRQIAHHLMQTYCPSILIVILSWISFWLDVEATPARVGLGLTSLLTLATQFSNAQKNLPAVAYVKALDVWMFTCMFLVFGSIMEFAVANHIIRCAKLSTVALVTQVQPGLKHVTPAADADPLIKVNNKIDRTSRFVFPATFIIFNFWYWIYYSSAANIN